VVFKAFDPILGRTVAIKMPAPELAASPAARQRFTREARASASIHNENVVGVYAVRELREVPYLVMEFVDGGCLEARVQEHGAMPVLLVAAAAHQVAAGLAAAHARGVVHGDLKPANVLIEAETGRAKVTDFGLARVADGAGTPFYTAPEVAQGKAATTHSDLFSLGCVLYVMATGRVPFAGQSAAEVLRAVTSAEPVPPGRLRPALPDWLENVILCLLRKDPACRPTAAAVAALFAEALG
jgi:serine/threonine protein kinase